MYILPNRKSPAKGVRIETDKPRVTVCSKNRVEWMAQEPVKRILHSVWLNEATAWLVGDYLLMPDHAHFFCGLRDSRFAVERWGPFGKIVLPNVTVKKLDMATRCVSSSRSFDSGIS